MYVPKKYLGELLLESKVITEDQLKIALGEQNARGGLLGEILVGKGFATEDDIANALSRQLNIPRYGRNELKFDRKIADIVPQEVCMRYRVLPVSVTDDKLVLAMVDPLNVYAIEDVERISGKEVVAVVVTDSTFRWGFAQLYGFRARTPAVLPTGAPGRPGGDEDRIIRLVDSIIDWAVSERASDVHIEPMKDTVRVRFRIDGVLYDVTSIDPGDFPGCVSRIKVMALMDISEHRLPQDGRIWIRGEGRDIDIRVSTLPTIFGEKVVLRIFDKRAALFRLEDLGFSPEGLSRYRKMINAAYGMILVTGPTGSGKTTTLMATLKEINTIDRNIITIEDPVEYQVEGLNQVQVNPRAGLTFATGLRSMLRQDPDVIMVGEIRDRETADIAVRSALTGHLVFSTLHTNDATGALTRLVDMGVEPFLVASSVVGCIAQRLVRVLCPRCKERVEVSPEMAALYGFSPELIPREVYRAVGCPSCNGTGFRGRTAVFEVVPMTSRLREMVNRKASADEIRVEAIRSGMKSLVDDGLDKVLKGITTLDEVQKAVFSEE